MHYLRVLLIGIAVLLVGSLLIDALHSDADGAAPSTHQPAHQCISTGQTVGWAHVGNDLGTLPLDWDNAIDTQRCRARLSTGGTIRYMRATADTPTERAEMTRMASTDAQPRYPIAVCPAGDDALYAIDLAYFYYASVKHISPTERRQYKGWLLGYAERHGCATYS